MSVLKKFVSSSFVWSLLAMLAFFSAVTVANPPIAYAYMEHSGTISTNQTWYAIDNPHVITGNVYVQGVGAPTLTIEPGCVVKFNTATRLYIGYNNTGALNAQGTDGNPIIFISDSLPNTRSLVWGIFW